jgi:hypothetical protein
VVIGFRSTRVVDLVLEFLHFGIRGMEKVVIHEISIESGPLDHTGSKTLI